MKDLTLKKFIADLSINTPYPGGGSVSSLVGALSVSLASMVGSYTENSKRYQELKEEMSDAVLRCSTLSNSLLELMNKDAAGFEPLAQAYKIPKDDPLRSTVYQAALESAMAAPLEAFALTVEAIDISLYMYRSGSRMLASDAKCAVILGLAALECSAIIVKVNSAELIDDKRRNDVEKYLDSILSEYKKKAEIIYD